MFGDNMINSIWNTSVDLPRFEQLKHDLKTDVLIIGGGLTGVLLALKLKELGVQYTLVEANTICSGVTLNTTAKITSQHSLIYSKINKSFGAEMAEMYYKSNEEALKEFKIRCKNIDCDFLEKDAIVYSLNRSDKINEECEVLKRINADFEFINKIEDLPFSIAGAVKFKNQAQFNPLKFVSAIVKDLKIYEKTKVYSFDGEGYVINGGKITANKTIVATHFPIFNKFGFYPLKLYQDRSYVLALQNAKKVDGMYIDENPTGLSFRMYDDLLLLGGGAHRTGKEGGNWKELNKFKNRFYPSSKEVTRWATQDCMSLDSIPYIGQYSKTAPDIFVATGYNKWGMTSSMVAANLLCDLVMGNDNQYSGLYSPSRKLFQPQLFTNIIESTINLLNPTTPRCPHLGCALKWNNAEKSWDCPCHGSRFSENGKLLDNPSTGDLKIKHRNH
ncbi:MAG: FAD-dependent oxidoreductase [Ruminococcaceae bacterium]|nr:FAD-dependent oxidoreductase [Oscillospiraceae bacterium]